MSDEKEKDLIHKLQLLKNALISERKKNSELENTISKLKKTNIELEKELELKDKEIIKHTSEKHKLISQIDFHRHKSFVATGVTSDFNNPSYFYDVDELTESIKRKASQYKLSVDSQVQIPREKEIYTDTKSTNSNSNEEEITSIVNFNNNKERENASNDKDKEKDLNNIVNAKNVDANNSLNFDTIDKKEQACLNKKVDKIELFEKSIEKSKLQEENTLNTNNASSSDEVEYNNAENKAAMTQIENKVYKIVDSNNSNNNKLVNSQHITLEQTNSTGTNNSTNNSSNNSIKNSISSKLNNIQSKFGSMFGKFFNSTSNSNTLNSNANNNNNNDNQASHLSSPRSGNSLVRKKSGMQISESQDSTNLNSISNSNSKEILIANYELVINHLQTENQNQKNLLLESNKNIVKVKEQFQLLITNQLQKIKSLENELNTSKDELIKYTQSTLAVMNQNKSYEVRLNNAENLIKQLQGELTACQETIKKFHLITEEKESNISNLNDNIKKFENENLILAKKLAELKSAIMEENVRTHVFSGKKKELFSSANFTLTFYKSEEGFFLVNYQEDNGKNQEIMELDDIDNIKVNNSNENSLDFVFIKNKKVQTWLLIFNENIHQVIRVYRDYRERVSRQKNMI